MQESGLSSLLRLAFDYKMSTVFTAIPCVIVRVDLANSMVDVQPSITELTQSLESTPLPIILAVPLVYPASSKSAFTFPVSVGDTVLCVFSQKGLDNFKQGSSGEPTRPTDFRKFDKRDAIAIPGLFPFSNAISRQSNRSLPHNVNDAVVSHNLGGGNEVEIRLDSNGNVKITSPNTVSVTAQNINVTAPSSSWNGNITLNGNYTINGTLTVDGIVFNTHTHSGVSPGSGSSGGPQ